MYGLPEDSNEIDWLKISTIDVSINSLNFVMRKHFSISYHFQMKEQRTAENCRNFWKNVAHPMINKSKWIQEEDDNLVKLTEQFEGRNWDKIAELLGVGTKLHFDAMSASHVTSCDGFMFNFKLNLFITISFQTGRSAFLCMKRYQTKFNPVLQK